MKYCSIKDVVSRHTSLLLFVMSIFPSVVLATWNEQGRDFSGELILEGLVTSVRNPWIWQTGTTHNRYQIKEKPQGSDVLMWQGLMSSQPLLIGKTSLVTPAGREGLAPQVSFGSGQSDITLNPAGDGVILVRLPVYSLGDQVPAVGSLQFRMKVVALIRYTVNGASVYAGLYNDLAGNGLPNKGLEMMASRSASELCKIFAGEGPDWLCSSSFIIRESEALSRFTDPSLRYIEGVYGVRTVAGSGTLYIEGKSIPSSWKAALPVSIEYH